MTMFSGAQIARRVPEFTLSSQHAGHGIRLLGALIAIL